MPRTSRKLLGNIFIHNMVQGINKEYIFQNGSINSNIINIVFNFTEEYLKKFNAIEYQPMILKKKKLI